MKGHAFLPHTVRLIALLVAVGGIVTSPAVSVAQPCLGSNCVQPALEWRFSPRVTADGKLRRCPSRYGIPDVSCDNGVRVVIVGDSIVAGVGDERFGNSGGGYVTRIQELLPRVTFSGFGTPGQNTQQLYKKVKTAIANNSPTSELGQALIDADIVILDIGRNDWFEVFKLDEPPSLPTYTRLRRLQSHLRARLTVLTGRTPLVILSQLLLPNRGGQGPWVHELNDRLGETSTPYSPANLPFDTVSKRLYNPDRLHPTAKGYDEVAKVLRRYLTVTVPQIWGKIRSWD